MFYRALEAIVSQVFCNRWTSLTALSSSSIGADAAVLAGAEINQPARPLDQRGQQVGRASALMA
jgi:hypothetical protein